VCRRFSWYLAKMEFDPAVRIINDFSTERLCVQHWSSTIGKDETRWQLAQSLVQILTPKVLEHLPPPLHVEPQPKAILKWIADRSKESDVYLVSTTNPNVLVGLLLLVNDAPQSKTSKVHIGYLLSQAAWGKGYASELIGGLLDEARTNAPMTLFGGVGRENRASAHILRKLGFSLNPSLSDDETEVFTVTIDNG